MHSNFSALRSRLRRLAPIHQTTFRAIIEHLGRVQSHKPQNKMDAKNLAVVFSELLSYDIGEESPADIDRFGDIRAGPIAVRRKCNEHAQ